MERLNKTRAFLTEFIIVILFFSVAAVIAINLYVEADQRNDESVLKSLLSMQVQSVAENIRAQKDNYSSIGMYTEYLDEDMCTIDEKKAQYMQKIIVSVVGDKVMTTGREYKYDIVISDIDSEEELFSLTFRQYGSGEVQQ